MARMYSRKKGHHGSKKPPIKIVPRWVKMKKKDVEELIVKLAKDKHSSAKIGTILRDQYGIPDVKTVIGKNVVEVMREYKLYPAMPEDMLSLLKQAVELHEHMSRNKGDNLSKKGMQNLESKIRRLGKYYSRVGLLEKDWKYDAEKAKLIIQQK
jgi:small subunit ribosomal protein S15